MFVVTGCAHSGTLATAVGMARCGIPTTHEQAFPHDLERPTTPLYRAGEVSWCAVPYVDELDVPVVRLVRHPLDVARSILRSRFLAPIGRRHAATEFVARHRPDIGAVGDHLERVVRYVTTWDAPVVGRTTVRVEAGGAGLLAIAAHTTGAPVDLILADTVARDLRDVNRHPGEFAPDVDARLRDHPRLFERAAELGYGWPT